MPLVDSAWHEVVPREPRSLGVSSHPLSLLHILTQTLREEFFYQLGLRQFGDFKRLKLDPPPVVRELIEIALDAEEELKELGMDADEIATVCS